MKIIRFITSKTLWANVLVFIVLCIVLFWGVKSWLNSYTRHGDNIVVPNLSRMDYNEALESLEVRELLAEVLDTSEFNPDFPRGSIINQYPEEGATVKKGRAIRLTINPMNPRKIEIPQLIEKTKRRAVYDLESKGFVIGELSYVPYIGKDVVVDVKVDDRSVTEKDRFPKGTVVNLVLGQGLGDNRIAMPYLRYMRLEEAKSMLLTASLNLGSIIYDEEVEDSTLAVVYNQSPSPSLTPNVNQGAQVDLWLTQDYTKIPNDSLQFLHPELADTTLNNASIATDTSKSE